MYAGSIVENAPVRELFSHPAHPYTRALLKACPRTDITVRRLEAIAGTVPPLTSVMPGCSFAPRCREAADECSQTVPSLRPLPCDAPSNIPDSVEEHVCACHRISLRRAS